MVEINNRDGLREWLEGKPKEWSVAIATRAALYAAPELTYLLGHGVEGNASQGIILATFRALSLPFAAARYSVSSEFLLLSAAAAARSTTLSSADSATDSPAKSAALSARSASFAAAELFLFAADAADAADYAARAAAADAARAAAADAARAATFAADAVWRSVRADTGALANGMSVELLMKQPLWSEGEEPLQEQWNDLHQSLLVLGGDWGVWVSWYEDRLAGRNTAGLPDDLAEGLDLKIAEQSNGWWERDAAEVNADIKEWIAEAKGKVEDKPTNRPPEPEAWLNSPRTIRKKLAEIVSPSAKFNEQGQLEAGPNPRLDVPVLDAEMLNLPEQQGLIVKSILAALPKNAPPVVSACLNPYAEHLSSRGTQPIVGLLQQWFETVEAAFDQEEGELWGKGLEKLFGAFWKNHTKIMEHFPLSEEREKIFSKLELDEEAVTYENIVEPVAEISGALTSFPGLSTDDVVALLDATVRNAKQIAAMQGEGSKAPKKRFVLSFLGFGERAYNLIGTTVGIASTPQGIALLSVLASNLDRLMMLVKSVI